MPNGAPGQGESARRAAMSRLDHDGLVDLARSALRVPSMSGDEERVARLFADAMAGVGLTAELQPVPESPAMAASVNALGRTTSRGAGRSLMFNGHLDHNPVASGWTVDPLDAVVRDGWLYGFVHMKAACAAYVMALDAVLRAGIELAGEVLVALVCGELRGGVGTRQLLSQGSSTDFFVLGEPTDLAVGLEHTASTVVRLHVLGSMKHFATTGEQARRGINAVEKAARLVAALGPSHVPLPDADHGGWLTYRPSERLAGLPQINIGAIRGGIGTDFDVSRPALFPDRCTVTVDVRPVPGMTKETIERDLVQLRERLRATDPDIDFEVEFAADTFTEPFYGDPDSEVVAALARAHELVNGVPPSRAESLRFAASDASWLAAAGIDGVVYGPSGRYLSRPDERCEIADLVRAAEVYACTVVDVCGA